jgi:hypothetical protein
MSGAGRRAAAGVAALALLSAPGLWLDTAVGCCGGGRRLAPLSGPPPNSTVLRLENRSGAMVCRAPVRPKPGAAGEARDLLAGRPPVRNDETRDLGLSPGEYTLELYDCDGAPLLRGWDFAVDDRTAYQLRLAGSFAATGERREVAPSTAGPAEGQGRSAASEPADTPTEPTRLERQAPPARDPSAPPEHGGAGP